ncbi:MAG: serine hydrolase domain-containing protein [Pseudomonadota bacterium]
MTNGRTFFSILAGVSFSVSLASLAATDEAGLAQRIHNFENGLRPALHQRGTAPLRWNLAERMVHHGVPGVSLAIIERGEIVYAGGYGVARAGSDSAVDRDTVFSVGSVSKVGAALTAHALVRDGVLDLDADINRYLQRWKLEPDATAAGRVVTLRGLMSHTAGLNVHGFDDFLPDEALPGVVDILSGRGAAKSRPVGFIHEPGSVSDYSGGGTTVTGLAIADVTGMDFQEAARKHLFEPLAMRRSTYEQPLPASHGNIAHAHDDKGRPNAEPRGWHSFPETAASGLWTTPSDTAAMLITLRDSYFGKPGAFLSRAHAQDVLTEVGPGRVGLGPFLRGSGTTRRFGHEGSNESYKALAQLYLDSGKGAVIFTNGARGADLYREMLRSIADAFDWPESEVTLVDPGVVQPALLDTFQGDYAVEPVDPRDKRTTFGEMQVFSIVSHDEGIAMALTVPLDGGGFKDVEYPLHAIARNEFVDAEGQRRFEFVLGTYRNLEGIILRHEGYAAFYRPQGERDRD